MAENQRTLSGQAIIRVLSFISRWWRQQPWYTSAIMVTMLLATIADVFTPVLVGRLIGTVSADPSATASGWYKALWLLLGLFGLGLIAILFRASGEKLSVNQTSVFMVRLCQQSFAHTQRFASDWHANTFAGSTVRKITRGVFALDLVCTLSLIELLPCLVMLIGTSLLLAWHWPLMGVVVGLMIIGYLVTVISMALFYMSPAANLSNQQDSRLTGAIADAITCNAVVKAFGAEQREEQRFDKVVFKWKLRMVRIWNHGVIYVITQQSLMWLFQLVILGSGVLLWQAQIASVGDIAYVMTAFFVLQGYLRDIAMQMRQLQRGVNDMEELVDLLDTPIGITDVPNASTIDITRGEIHFENVSFRYPHRDNWLYHDFSLTIRAGERIGLVGHSGSGKTSFIKLIQRLHDIDSGHILIDGQDIAQVQQSSLRSQLAIVQQEPILFHRSLAENIAYARPDASQQEIEQAARQANAHEFITEQPKGYFTLVGERGVKLSGGERQRIAIARAFLSDAPILILDEATSSLDSQSEALIQEAIERLMEGRTTIVIAHRLSTVKALDRLIVMDHGKVIEQGTHAELIDVEGGVYQGLFKRQALDLINEMEASAK